MTDKHVRKAKSRKPQRIAPLGASITTLPGRKRLTKVAPCAADAPPSRTLPSSSARSHPPRHCVSLSAGLPAKRSLICTRSAPKNCATRKARQTRRLTQTSEPHLNCGGAHHQKQGMTSVPRCMSTQMTSQPVVGCAKLSSRSSQLNNVASGSVTSKTKRRKTGF